MSQEKLSLSVGEMSKNAIIERAEKRVPTTSQDQHWISIQIEKEIKREKDEVFKKEFMGSPWDRLGIESFAGGIGYLAFLFYISSGFDGVTQVLLMLGLSVILLIVIYEIFKNRTEDAFKSGVNSDWHRYEPEYRKALEEIHMQVEQTRPKRNR